MAKMDTINSSGTSPLIILRASPGLRRGFSFTEVLFAVMILGIGFIMIAAIFPATIQQTSATLQDTHGANVGQAAIQFLQSIASDRTMPVTYGQLPIENPSSGPSVVPLQFVHNPPVPPATASDPSPGWLDSLGNYICTQNRRYAWVALYRRDMTATGPAEYAQVFVIVAQSRNRPEFAWADVLRWNGSQNYNNIPTNNPPSAANRLLANLEPRWTKVRVWWNATKQGGELEFRLAKSYPMAASGAFVIIAMDDTTSNGVKNRSTGRIYQLGNPMDNTGQRWELAPGGDMLRIGAGSDDNDLAVDTEAYILGRGFLDPANGVFDFGGGAMDVAIYTSFVRINN